MHGCALTIISLPRFLLPLHTLHLLGSVVCCLGHEQAVPVDHMVQTLDVYEEGITTLLCYMEVQGWLEVLPPINDTCILKCYGGSRQLSALSKKVPAIALAFAQMKRNEGKARMRNEFQV